MSVYKVKSLIIIFLTTLVFLQWSRLLEMMQQHANTSAKWNSKFNFSI
ncbi:MAG: hypothetical protein IPF52_13485 [Saprospiraceae bacterium]|nr:hypothetical protein [Saprospiraceae bacterium]